MMTLFSEEEVMKRHDAALRFRTRNQTIVENIKSLMDSLNFTAEQVMDAMKIPQENREILLKLMAQPPQLDDED